IGEAEAAVEAVRVARPENPAADRTELQRAEHGLHQPLSEPAAAVRLEDEDVGEIRGDDGVGHDAGKPHLPARGMEAERDRMRDGERDALPWPPLRPVRLHEETVDDVEVEAPRVRADRVVAARPLVDHRSFRPDGGAKGKRGGPTLVDYAARRGRK